MVSDGPGAGSDDVADGATSVDAAGGRILARTDDGEGPITPPHLPAPPTLPLPTRAVGIGLVIVASLVVWLALLAVAGDDDELRSRTDSDRVETVGSDREPSTGSTAEGDDRTDRTGLRSEAETSLVVPPTEEIGPAPETGRGSTPAETDPQAGTTASTGGTDTSSSTVATTARSSTSTTAATTSVTSTTSTTRKPRPGDTAPGRDRSTTTSTLDTTTSADTSSTETSAPTEISRTDPARSGGSNTAPLEPDPAVVTGPPAGTVIWEDHFDRLDTSTWSLEHSTYGDGNRELQCYRPENVSVRDGALVLAARTETAVCPGGSVREVSSGMVRSQGVDFSPGQAIEFRVKLTPADPDDQGGLWPAVWASSWAGSWPRGGELDWLEVMTAEDPTRAMFSLHYAGPDGRHRLQNRGVSGGEDFSAAWHTVRFDYGLDGRLRWYLDGRLAFAVDGADTLQGYPAPFDRTIGEIKINLALGGTPGPLAPGAVGTTGATFAVDYIRILQL